MTLAGCAEAMRRCARRLARGLPAAGRPQAYVHENEFVRSAGDLVRGLLANLGVTASATHHSGFPAATAAITGV